MIGNDCRCPGCGTCAAASDIKPLRKTLKEEKQRYDELFRMNQTYINKLHETEKQRDNYKLDYGSLEQDAARVILAYLNGDKIELDEAVDSLKSNGRHKWWEDYKPIGLRGESDDDAERTV